jgi:hypothetical protein
MGTNDDRRWTSIMASIAIVATAAVLLLSMGRDPIYRSGFRLWYGNAWGPENSQQLSDPYTFTHVTHGVLFYALLHLLLRGRPLRVRALTALAAESAWEVLENTDAVIDRYRTATMALGYYGDSVINSLGDIGACMIGFALAAALPARATASLVVLLELALTVTIRDSLLLNIVMLVHPIEAVRVWQLGAGG